MLNALIKTANMKPSRSHPSLRWKFVIAMTGT